MISQFLLSLVLHACFGEFGNAASINMPTAQPNIIIILADDMGFNDVSYLGSTQIPTPNIDRLAADGVIFTRFYVQPICTPTRSALMSSKYPFHIGMQGAPIRDGEPRGLPINLPILPQYLKKLGYSTHLVGKWHLGQYETRFFPHKRGFDTFLGTPAGATDYYDYTTSKGYALYNNSDILLIKNKTYITDLFTTWTEEAIDRHAQGPEAKNPFFLYFTPTTPHAADKARDYLQAPPYYMNRPEVDKIPDKARKEYAAMVISLDESVARIYQSLVKNKMENNTIIWFFSDNGGPVVNDDVSTAPKYKHTAPASNWPFRGSVGGLWEGGVHLPAYVWGAKEVLNKKGTVSNQLFHVTDILPTLVAIAGGGPEFIKNIDGVSQWDSLKSGSHISPRSVLPIDINNDDESFALISGDYKIIRGDFGESLWYRPPGTSDQDPQRVDKPGSIHCNHPEGKEQTICNPAAAACLFNLADDPCETNNIAALKPEILKQLLELVSKFNETYVTPINEPIDPLSAPSLHGGNWVPWFDEKNKMRA